MEDLDEEIKQLENLPGSFELIASDLNLERSFNDSFFNFTSKLKPLIQELHVILTQGKAKNSYNLAQFEATHYGVDLNELS